MNMLSLGPKPSPISEFLNQRGYSVIEYNDLIDTLFLKKQDIDFAISYRYRHIIRPEIITYLDGKIINLHISCLPWNKGSDPNLWSFLEDTPKGVTIHYVDSGIDTGDIIVQKQVVFDEEKETLSSTYDILNNEIVQLLKDNWKFIIRGEGPRIKQKGTGTVHNSRDKEPYQYLLAEKGWDTPVMNIKGLALPKRD